MQFIQTTEDHFIYSLVDDMSAVYENNEEELEYEIDFDVLGDAIEKDDAFTQFKELVQVNDIDKLDKKNKYNYGIVLFGLIPDIKENLPSEKVYEALELAYNYIKDDIKLFVALYNVFEAEDKFRNDVFLKLLEVLEDTKRVPVILNNLKRIDNISKHWSISTEDRIFTYKKVGNLLVSNEQTYDAYLLMLKTMDLFGTDTNTIENNEDFIAQAIIIAIQHPKVVQFDILSNKPALKIQAMEHGSDQLFQLLEIFATGTINDYIKWEKENSKFMNDAKIDVTTGKNKMMYLSIGMHVDQSEGSSTSVIEYSKLAEIVGIKREEIEEWIIDAIVNNIIDARLDQENECIIFNSFAKRNMNDMSEWKNLKQKIKDTQTKFDKVLKLIRPK